MFISVIRTTFTRRVTAGLANKSAEFSTCGARPNAASDEAKGTDNTESKKTSPTHDLYSTLGITREATQTEIREAFFRRAKELHPDVNPSDEAKEEFALAQEAFEKLKDPKRRRSHDDGLADDDNLEKRLENMDVYLSTRKQFGAKKIWSERLEGDLMRASMWRIAKRGDLKKKMLKPHEEYKRKWTPKPNWMLGETAETPIDAGAKKTWFAMGQMLVLTTLVVVMYYVTERGISPRERLWGMPGLGRDEVEQHSGVEASKSETKTWRTLIYGAEWADDQKDSNVK